MSDLESYCLVSVDFINSPIKIIQICRDLVFANINSNLAYITTDIPTAQEVQRRTYAVI